MCDWCKTYDVYYILFMNVLYFPMKWVLIPYSLTSDPYFWYLWNIFFCEISGRNEMGWRAVFLIKSTSPTLRHVCPDRAHSIWSQYFTGKVINLWRMAELCTTGRVVRKVCHWASGPRENLREVNVIMLGCGRLFSPRRALTHLAEVSTRDENFRHSNITSPGKIVGSLLPIGILQQRTNKRDILLLPSGNFHNIPGSTWMERGKFWLPWRTNLELEICFRYIGAQKKSRVYRASEPGHPNEMPCNLYELHITKGLQSQLWNQNGSTRLFAVFFFSPERNSRFRYLQGFIMKGKNDQTMLLIIRFHSIPNVP